MKNYTITVNGNVYDVTVEEKTTGAVTTPVKATVPVTPVPATSAPVAAPAAPTPAPTPAPTSSGVAGSIEVTAGAAGKVFSIPTKVGQVVKAGEAVVVIEAMKMEIPVVAPQDGTVASINVVAGDAVEAGAVLATLN